MFETGLQLVPGAPDRAQPVRGMCSGLVGQRLVGAHQKAHPSAFLELGE